MSPTPRQLGRRLATIRKAQRLSRYALAKRLTVSRDYLGRVERGDSSPTVEMLQHIAQALGMPLVRMLDEMPEAPTGGGEGPMPQTRTRESGWFGSYVRNLPPAEQTRARETYRAIEGAVTAALKARHEFARQIRARVRELRRAQ